MTSLTPLHNFATVVFYAARHVFTLHHFSYSLQYGAANKDNVTLNIIVPTILKPWYKFILYFWLIVLWLCSKSDAGTVYAKVVAILSELKSTVFEEGSWPSWDLRFSLMPRDPSKKFNKKCSLSIHHHLLSKKWESRSNLHPNELTYIVRRSFGSRSVKEKCLQVHSGGKNNR